jgi:hypothetical protein
VFKNKNHAKGFVWQVFTQTVKNMKLWAEN